MKTRKVILTNASVLDVDAAAITPDQDIVIEDSRIVDVRPSGTRNSTEHQIVDLRGRIAMPGLIDAHVHVTSVIGNSAFVARLSPYYIAVRASQIMGQMLQRGFTSVRDVGGADWGLSKAVEENIIEAPRLFFGGPAMSQTGGHGDMRSEGDAAPFGTPGAPRIDHVVDGVEGLRRAAREELRKGADHLKIFLSGGVAASPTDQFDAPQYSDEEIAVVVAEARASRRYVVAHAYNSEAINRGLDLGVRSIEHGNLLDESAVPAFLDNQAFLVPTLSTYDAMAREGVKHGVPDIGHWPFAAVLEWAQRALEIADRGGVDIVYGTDLLGAMHQFQSAEFALRAPLQSSQRVLQGATTTAARLLCRETDLGKIAPDFLADLIVVEGNPLDDVSLLSRPEKNVRLVMKSGIAYRDDLS